MRFLAVIIASLSFLSSFSEASPVPLFEKESAAPLLPGYTESVNRSIGFYTWQNDPELSQFFRANGNTALCVPSALSTQLLYQYSKKSPRLPNLSIPGLSVDGKSANTAEAVKGLIEFCKIKDASSGTEPEVAARCLRQFYFQTGYSKTQVTLIRENIAPSSEDGYHSFSRAPQIKDIYEALKKGDEVIASVAFMKWDSKEQNWSKSLSHAINVFGYSRNESDGNEKLLIYYSNPTRAYRMNFSTPISEVAILAVNDSLVNMPYSSKIEITQKEGRLIELPGLKTILVGLIITHTEP